MADRLCVLFAGNAGHGKDTVANMMADVCRQRGLSPLRLAFADPIKDIAVHLLGIPKSVSYGTQEDKLNYKVYGKTARHWLQWIGTELGRDQVHKDIWIERFAQRALESDARVIIGSDCRFPNERAVTRELLGGEMGLVIVKINNPRVPVNLDHESESLVFNTPDSEFDHIIHNSSSLSDLMSDVEDLASKLLAQVS